MKTRALLIAAALLVCTSSASAHDWYTNLRNSAGAPCCGGNDCAPVAANTVRRSADGGIELLLAGRWIKVEEQNILPVDSPDGQMHACVGKTMGITSNGDYSSVPFVRCLILPAQL